MHWQDTVFFVRTMPTTGNLFHHSVELYLKGYLCLELNELQRIKLRHSLKRIWRLFKKKVKDPTLKKFDSTIAVLDRFESIRYPEKSVRLGMQVHFSLAKPVPSTGPTKRDPPIYLVTLNEIDELVATLFQKSELNPRIFPPGLSAEGKAYLKQDNPTGLWDP